MYNGQFNVLLRCLDHIVIVLEIVLSMATLQYESSVEEQQQAPSERDCWSCQLKTELMLTIVVAGGCHRDVWAEEEPCCLVQASLGALPRPSDRGAVG